MRAQSLIFSTLVIWLAFIVKSHAQTVSPQQCATSVHAILARGEGPGDDLNVLVTVQDLILKQIPGATSIGLPYDHGNSNKELAVYSGTLLMQQYIRDYVASCPNAKIALLGYSMVCDTKD
jgi:acetylxylan esterase